MEIVDGKVSENVINELLGIISDDEIDADLFWLQVGSLGE